MDKTSLLRDSSLMSPFSRRSRLTLTRDESINFSNLGNDTSMLTFNDTSIRQLSSTLVANPSIAGEGLHEMFFEVMQTSSHTDILDTISRLVQACCDSLELVEPWNRYLEHNRWLSDEASTWRLLYSLYSDSLQIHTKPDEEMKTDPELSQQVLVGKLFDSDSELRLLQLIVDWLEASAAYEDSTTPSTNVIGNRVHWGNTLHNLLLGSSLFNKENNKSMVTSMDPDAPRRQKKTLHSDDQQDDDNLCRRIFKEVRCGRFDEATTLCMNAGQTWRSVVLQGWRLLTYNREPNAAKLEMVGNPNRDLWKWCCMGLVNDTSENTFYRATVGVLCGHLPSALSVCEGKWDDILWVHLRVQIEARVDKFLREHYSTAAANTTPLEVLEMLQKEYQPNELSLQQIFGCVNALMNNKAESYYKTCQRYLILGHITSIMEEAEQWLEAADDRFICFLAHLVLLLRLMGKDPQHEIGDQVLECYVMQLIENKNTNVSECPEMIAYYTSTVPVKKQPSIYSNMMEFVDKREHRERVVKAATLAGLDIGAASRLTIKKAINEVQQGYGNFDVTFNPNSKERDRAVVNPVINTLEWLSLDENQVEDAFWLSNAMMRTFLFLGDTDAAVETLTKFKKLFPNAVSQVNSTSTSLREHLCIKAYLDALDGFSTWYRHFISGCPKDLEPLHDNATFTDKVHYEQKCAQLEQLKERWSAANFHQAKHAKSFLYSVLLFPGGFLQDQSDSTKSENFSQQECDERVKQLETLKRLCIPEVVILILRILQSVKDVESHIEAIRLSDLIAAENRCLYKVIPKDKLREILQKIVDSSVVLLDSGRDVFGYENAL